MVQAQPERTEVEDQLTHSLPATSATTKGRASAKLDQANPHARDSPPDAQVESSPRLIDEITLHVITAALTNCPAHEDDWVELGQLGKMLVRISPDMIPRNYGYSRLRDFVEASGLVDWQAKPKSGGGRRCSSGSSYFVRLKEPDTTTPDTQALSVEETISQPSIRRQRDAAIPDAQDLSVSKTKGRTSKHKRRDATETNPHERRSQPVEKAEARRTKRKRRDSTEAGVQERDDLALSVKQIEARPVKRKRRHE